MGKTNSTGCSGKVLELGVEPKSQWGHCGVTDGLAMRVGERVSDLGRYHCRDLSPQLSSMPSRLHFLFQDLCVKLLSLLHGLWQVI